MVATYHVNRSFFTSVPDFWAIGQLFPILPIDRFDEESIVKGVFSDLTCDSDGKMERFINREEIFPLYEAISDTYCIGMFLGGAYQEALDGLNNLFGWLSVARFVQSDGPHRFAVTHAVPGASCADVLRIMHHEPEVMYEVLKRHAEEYGDDGGHIAWMIARAVVSTPYLVGISFGDLGAEGDADAVHHGDELKLRGLSM